MMDDIPREDELVRILSRAPDVLLPGLTFIGREISLRGQIVDLVGVDREGRLCIFEVKRAIESLAGPWQLVKYAAAFESLNDDDLVRLLTEQSGGLNLEETGNFDNWYRERPFEKGISSARPVRLYLVVIGEDETDVANDRATVDAFVFLAERGIDLSLVFVPIADLYAAVNPATFGISDRMHVEPGRGGIQTQSNVIVEPPSRQITTQRMRAAAERELEAELMENLEIHIQQRQSEWSDLKYLWGNAQEVLWHVLPSPRTKADGRARIYRTPKWEWANYRLNFQIYNRKHSAVAIEADPFEDIFRVIFFGAYVDFCKEEFEEVAARWHDEGSEFSTWDPHLGKIGLGEDRPVRFPRWMDENEDLRNLEYCPEIKFEFRSIEHWNAERDTMAALAGCIFEKSRRVRIPPLPPSVVEIVNRRSRL